MDHTLSPEDVRKVLQGISIPPQPQILVDLQMEQIMPNPDLRRISQLISQDPGLAGSVLKIVNSSAFGLRNHISSIPQAVQLLGLSTLINVLNGISIKSEMSDDTIVQLGRFWDTAIDIARVCTCLAGQLGLRNPDEGYALGLFHNCGIPLLMRRFDHYLEVVEASYRAHEHRIIDVENQHLNTNHAVVGYYVARSWHLPTHLGEIIAEHHNVESIFIADEPYPHDKKRLLAVLKIAEHFCGNHRLLGQQEQDYEWERIELPLLSYMGLSQDQLENLRDDLIDAGQLSG